MYRYKFSETEETDPRSSEQPELDLISTLRSSIISSLATSPFGFKTQVLYADHTASGQGLKLVERFVSDRVLPVYGNTHSVSTVTARMSTFLRHEARELIKNYFNLGPEFACIFAGNGATGAISKFTNIMKKSDCFSPESRAAFAHFEIDRWGAFRCTRCDVRLKNDTAFRAHCLTDGHQKTTPVHKGTSTQRKIFVFIDPMAHHSLILPIRELAANTPHFFKILTLPDTAESLHSMLRSIESIHGPSSEFIGMLCYVSNITGLVRDVHAFTRIFHSFRGIVCWDAAAAAGHVKTEITADFVFLSAHKLLGGPGASGVLLARRKWLINSIPGEVGGGTVFYVKDWVSEAEAETGIPGASFIANPEEREEAGTPNVLADVRAGAAFFIQHQVSRLIDTFAVESRMRARFLEAIKRTGSVDILGEMAAPSTEFAAIVSFNVRYIPERILLHHNFVTAVLNDLFGVQARGGCACAGPFAQKLLGLSSTASDTIEAALERSGQDILRPGFVRVGFHYSMTDEEVDGIIRAVEWIGLHGWKLLPLYTIDVVTGEWKHRRADYGRDRFWISDMLQAHDRSVFASSIPSFESRTELALSSALKINLDLIGHPQILRTDLIWFAVPSDYRATRLFNAVAAVLDSSIPRVSLNDTGFGHARDTDVVQLVEPNQQSILTSISKKKGLLLIPKKLRASVTTAMKQFKMINPGDRVLIGLSGGKDSLSLLHILLSIQKMLPFKFEIAAATIDPMTPEYDPFPLVEYMRTLGVPYHLISEPIMELAKTHMDPKKQSICSFCSRMKRGLLYKTMRENNYNVLALGQHLDDLAESFVMSAFRNGSLKTMKANYLTDNGGLRVIRPLVFVRERQTEEFARAAQLPIIKENCPACFSAPKERRRIKMLLSEEEYANETVFNSLMQCMLPLMSRNRANGHEEEEDYGAEEVLQPCAGGICPLPKKRGRTDED